MPNQFFSPEGDLENYFVTESWLIDQWVGDELWTWGRNDVSQLGINATGNRSTPVTTFAGGTNWKQVAGGFKNKAAIKTDGTLWTWGINSFGILGDNTSVTKSTPVTTFAGGTNWRQVSSAQYHAAAIKTDGTLWCWGLNQYSQIGINATGARSTPVTTFSGGTNWKQVSCGGGHIAATKTDGTLWLWGRNSFGIGDNTTVHRSTPVTTFAGGTNWKQVSGGGVFTAAIKTDGTLWLWGYNNYGNLGDNTTIQKNTPITTFTGGTNWKQVSSGGYHTAAIKTNGTLWTWGYGARGELGDNTITLKKSIPSTTFSGGTNWKQISGGDSHTAAIKTDGTLWIWGSSAYAQLGANDSIQKNTPVTSFAGGTNWKQVSAEFRHTSAVFSGTTPDLPIS